MIAGVGGGARVRHTIALALDLGIPPGGIAQLVESMETVNALLLNVLGMRKVIYVKDQDGLYDHDPALHDDARLIRETTLEELLENLPEELILDNMLVCCCGGTRASVRSSTKRLATSGPRYPERSTLHRSLECCPVD